ncbi:MAG: right-handed parallel beta-helix repeat-containing protein [Candidatus Hatepunaea meridiana]|nr:right-handed parallel beta-helix repeat-containing protein [Candidatus Hatepunaea meridiana]
MYRTTNKALQRRIITLIWLILSVPLFLFALEQNSPIDADETWGIFDSPVTVDGIITIAQTVSLTIEPGVQILFNENSGMIVLGKLIARGSVDDSIRFTSANAKEPGAWGGLYFRGTWRIDSSKIVKEKIAFGEEEKVTFKDAKGNVYTQIGEYFQRQDGIWFFEDEDGGVLEYVENNGVPIFEEEITDGLLDTLTLSLLEYCIVEYAGASIEKGSSIEITNSHPIITHSTVRNSRGSTGMIRCNNQSQPLIQDCMIINNQANRGGAISIGLNANPKLLRNSFIFNYSDDHGGAIYISLASAEIISNTFIRNQAAAHGGAIFGTISPKIIIRGNDFLGNRSPLRSNALCFTSRASVEMSENIFDSDKSTGVEIYLENAIEDIKATNNFWGDPNSFSFHNIIRDRRSALDEPLVYYEPFLWASPTYHPTNPSRVDEIILCRDDAYTEEIPRGVAEGAPLRIRLTGEDVNPYYRDIVNVKVVSEFDTTGIVIPLRETAVNSGVWIKKGQVDEYTDQEDYAIGGCKGGSVDIFAPIALDVVATYPTMSPKPMAENLTVANTPPPGERGGIEGDVLHLIYHTVNFKWDYFDVIEAPQLSYKLSVFPALRQVLTPDATTGSDAATGGHIAGSPIWITGEVQTEEKIVTYMGPDLIDGESYIAELYVNNDRFWSDPVQLLFRMNSVPTAPQPDKPVTDELVPTLTPQLFAGISNDKEDDSLTYRFEVYSLKDNKLVAEVNGASPYRLVTISGETIVIDSTVVPKTETVLDSLVSWVIPDNMIENDGYNFRVKAFDPLEEGPWSDYRKFWVNATEEPTDPFDLEYPVKKADIYLLHPELKWGTAVDPDPLSFVRYTVEIDKSARFNNPRIYTDLTPIVFTLPDSLDNKTEYFWRITATDNTNRTTVSTSVGNFYVDTTPTVPKPNAPLAGEERSPSDVLSWDASSDPNPNDLIFYEVEIFESSVLRQVLTPDATTSGQVADIAGWRETSLPVEKLNRWEDLVDNHVYTWRVRSRDNHTAASEFSATGSFFYNKFNDPPVPVQAFTSPTDTVMGTTDIGFKWKEASDPDLSDPVSTLIYDLQCVLGDFESGSIRNFSSEAGQTNLVASLDDNLLWNYRIRTRDNDGAVSPWSKTEKVLVNFAEDAPTPFVLQNPSQASLVVELDSLMFTWASSSDPDWESSIKYRFELFPEKGKKFTTKTSNTYYHFKGGLTNEAGYRWSVTAIDNTGLETVVQESFSFSTNTTPTAPAAASMPRELMPPDPFEFTGATDPNPVDVLTYTVEVAPNESFNPALVHVEKLPHSAGIMKATVGSLAGQEKLDDDKDYYFKVRATDNHGYKGAFSEPVVFRFNRENDPPGQPKGPFTPIDSVVVRSQKPRLDWSEASDIDLTDPPDKLVYDIHFDYDGEFKKDSKFEYNTAAGITEFTTTDDLQDNTLWFWQVRTRDDDGAVSKWSTMEPFLVNVVEDPPTVPQLTTPANGDLLNYLGPINFKWVASRDIDFMSSITYRIEYGTSSDLSGATVIDRLTDPAYTAAYPLKNTTYYWRVIAIDNTGLETASAISNFTLDTRPSIPRLLTPQPAMPIPMAELLSDGVMTWSKSTDPNPKDKITYTIQVGIQLEPTGVGVVSAKDIIKAGIPISTWKNELKDDQVYNWRVKAIDEHKIESDWSEPLTFFYNPTNDNPGPVTGVLSPVSDLEVPSIQLGWGEASDMDISDPPERIAYTVEMTSDPDFKKEIKKFTTPKGINTLAPKCLKDEIRWYWRVRAVDDEGAEGSVSRENVFIYNTQNDPPGVIPGLITPVNAQEVSFVKLYWQAASDKDLTDSASIAYQVELCRDKKFKGEIVDVKTDPMITTVSPTGLEDDSWWFWRVRAVDNDGAEGPVSEVRGFTYNSSNDPPNAVSALLSPGYDEEVPAVKLSWGAADDKDISDSTVTLSYLAELSPNQDFSGRIVPITTKPNVTKTEPTGLADDSYWYWRVRAVDDDGVKGQLSEIRRLILNTRNDPPGKVVNLLKPAEGQGIAAPILEWEPAPDRDITDTPDRLMYIVELCQDKGFAKKITTLKTKPGVNTAQPVNLADDSWWHWRVKAKDDDGLEGPLSNTGSFIYNTSNDAPERVSELLTPKDGIEVSTLDLNWRASTDNDITDPPEKLIYRLEFSPDRSFSSGVVTFTTNPGVTSARPQNVADNSTWYWRVSAVDDDGLAGAPSVIRSFTYNTANDPPEKVNKLLDPPDNAEVTSVSLVWRAASDPDPFDTPDKLTYAIELSKDRSYASGVVSLSAAAGVTATSPRELDDNSVWYWRVKAVDDEGTVGAFSPVSSFIYNKSNDPPNDFKLTSPVNGITIEGKRVKLTWTQAIDVDPGDRISYTVVLARDAGFTTGLGTFRDISNTEFMVPGDVIGEGGQLFWKVSASDKKGSVTWGSDSDRNPQSFTVKPQ